MHHCCSCTGRHKNRVVEIVVVHFVQLSFFFQCSPKNKHPMPSNPFELAVATFFKPSAMIGVIKSLEQPLKL